jgi:hypothetical protein
MNKDLALRVAAAAVLLAAIAVASPAPAAQNEPAAIEPPDAESGQEAPEAPAAESAPEGEDAEGRVYKGEQVSILSSIHVLPNEVVRGQVVCIGCDVIVEGEVTDDIVVVGGSLKLSGSAGHDVVCVMSSVEVAEGVTIEHDFVNVLGTLDDQGAVVGNERVSFSPFGARPNLPTAFGAIGTILLYFKIVKTVLVFVVILILVTLVPDRVRTLSDEFPFSYGIAMVAGVGGYIVLWVVNTLLLISVIGIPVVFLLQLVFLVLKVLGLAGILHYTGMRFGRSMGRDLSLLGAILVAYLFFSLALVVPHFFGLVGFLVACGIRLLFWLLFECPAIGLILLTRAGSRPRTIATAGSTGAPPAPAGPPAPSPVAPA